MQLVLSVGKQQYCWLNAEIKLRDKFDGERVFPSEFLLLWPQQLSCRLAAASFLLKYLNPFYASVMANSREWVGQEEVIWARGGWEDIIDLCLRNLTECCVDTQNELVLLFESMRDFFFFTSYYFNGLTPYFSIHLHSPQQEENQAFSLTCKIAFYLPPAWL